MFEVVVVHQKSKHENKQKNRRQAATGTSSLFVILLSVDTYIIVVHLDCKANKSTSKDG